MLLSYHVFDGSGYILTYVLYGIWTEYHTQRRHVVEANRVRTPRSLWHPSRTKSIGHPIYNLACNAVVYAVPDALNALPPTCL